MKLGLVPCIQCEKEQLAEQYWVEGPELRDDLAFDIVCPHGHKTLLIWQAQKFEILFEMGSSALLDGYSREAISSFAAAQERFHEFCIKVFLVSRGVKKDEVLRTWKLAANQSERQLGAYYFLHLLHFNAAPPANQKMVEFRNNVIHKGFIPPREQAFAYAEYVYSYIIDAIRRMRPDLNDAVGLVCRTDLEDMLESVPKGVMTRSAAAPTMIGLSRAEDKFGRLSFAQALKERREDHKLELERRIEDLEEEEAEEDE